MKKANVLKQMLKKSTAVLSVAAMCVTAFAPVTYAANNETSTPQTTKVEKYVPLGSYTTGHDWVTAQNTDNRYNNITVHFDNCGTQFNEFESGYQKKIKIYNRNSGKETGTVQEQGKMLFENMDLTNTKYSLSFDFKVFDDSYLKDGKDGDRSLQLHFQDKDGKYVNYFRLNDGYMVMSLSGYSMGRYTSDNVDHKVVPYEKGKWTNVEYTVDTKTRELKWYINGALVATGAIDKDASTTAAISKMIVTYGDSRKLNEYFMEFDNFKVARIEEEEVSAIDKTKQLLYNDYEAENSVTYDPNKRLGSFTSVERVDSGDDIHKNVAKLNNSGSDGYNYGMLWHDGFRHKKTENETEMYYDDCDDTYIFSFDVKASEAKKPMYMHAIGRKSNIVSQDGEVNSFGFLFDKNGYFGSWKGWYSTDLNASMNENNGKTAYKDGWNAVDMVFNKTNKQVSLYLNGGFVNTLNISDTEWVHPFKIRAEVINNGYYFDNMRVLNVANNSFWYDAKYVGNDIVLDFNQQLVNQDLSAIQLKDEKGNKIGVSSARYDGHKVVLTPAINTDYCKIEMPEHTMGSGGYLLSQTDTVVKKPRFKFDMKLTANDTEIQQGSIGKLQTNQTIKLAVDCENTTDKEEKVTAIAAAYNDKGMLTAVDLKNLTATKNTETVTFAEVPTFNLPAGTSELKAFAWKNDGTPISDSIVINNMKTTEHEISDTTVKQLGRYANANAGGRTYNWPGSGIEFKFNGTGAAVNVSEVTGWYNLDGNGNETISSTTTEEDAPYFTIEVDGENKGRVAVRNAGKVTLASGLEKGEHTIKFTRSGEALRGKLSADKIYITSDEEEAVPVPTEAKTRKLEFYGDSYTAGYGNLYDQTGSAWATGKNTDFYNSYAAVTARAFDADINTIAISGKGIVKNGDRTSELTNMTNQLGFADIRIKSTDTPAEWDFAKYTPNAVVVFLGTNDKAASVSDSDFTQGYTNFLTKLAEKYNEKDVKYILIAKPDVYNSTMKTMLEDTLGWTSNGDETGIYFYTFSEFYSDCLGHPGAANHKKLAKEMAEFIKGATGWDYTAID